MLKKFNDFMLESLLLESNLIFSDKFRNLLTKIDSPVAKGLIDSENKDLTLTNNYIDVGDDKEQMTFIPDRRAQQLTSSENREKYCYWVGSSGILKHTPGNADMFKLLEYEPTGDRAYHPNNSEKGEILKQVVSPTSGKTYCKVQFPGGITVINKEQLRFDDVTKLPFTQFRQPIRIGRGIRPILNSAGLKFSDSEIEQFVNKYRSEYDKMNDAFRLFEVVEGDLIAHWYNHENYELGRGRGQLGNSCMCAVPARYLEIYTANPDVCKLVILKTEDGKKIKGRALLWKLSTPENLMYMDRIYTHLDSDIELFRQYCKFRKWNYKEANVSTENTSYITPEGNTEHPAKLSVIVKAKDYNSYPYLDTLKYYQPDTGELTTDDEHYGRGSGWYNLEDTGGGHADSESCDWCGGEGRVDCPECDGDGEVECGECDGSGQLNCRNCGGDGKVDCPDCDGKGEDEEGNECENCEGEGKVDCEDCDGNGENECPDCNGSGNVECRHCDGRGRVDCPECQ
jgi:hypothetical protein